jgi:hypothetical protein
MPKRVRLFFRADYSPPEGEVESIRLRETLPCSNGLGSGSVTFARVGSGNCRASGIRLFVACFGEIAMQPSGHVF